MGSIGWAALDGTHPTQTSKMLLPTEEETAMSPKPFLATITLVMRSGTDVPAARIVRPTTCNERRVTHNPALVRSPAPGLSQSHFGPVPSAGPSQSRSGPVSQPQLRTLRRRLTADGGGIRHVDGFFQTSHHLSLFSGAR